MRNIRMTISYDGTQYYGFQTQPGGNTIQDELQAAIYSLTKEKVQVTGSGRTDAGVHARAQVINFYTESPIPPMNWKKALNSRLPEDILILKSEEVALDFHSRKDAVGKTYCYFINSHPDKDVFRRNYELHYPKPIDVNAMRTAAEHLKGTHDFTSFSSIHSNQRSHIRTITSVHIEQLDPDGHRIRLAITGNGFLYNMVRIITGTLLDVGTGKLDASAIPVIIAAKDRSKAGPTAPGHGLYLWEVFY